jgi:predicted ferric reductase
VLLWFCAAAVAGIIAAGGPLANYLPHFDGEHSYWHLGRASGFVAYGLFFGSIVLGLGLSSRVFDGWIVRPWVYEMHQFMSLYVLIAIVFHALIMLPDPYAQFKVWEMLVPFASHYRPLAVAAGVIVLYGSTIVALSFYVKRVTGQKVWRWLHYTSFALFLLAMVHGIYAGTDTGEQWAQLTYLASGLVVLFLTFFRILASKRAERQPGAAAKRVASRSLAQQSNPVEPRRGEAG